MDDDTDHDTSEKEEADKIERVVTRSPDDIRFAGENALEETVGAPYFLGLVLVKGSHQRRIGRVALLAVLDSLAFGQHFMRDHGAVVLFFGMALHATHGCEVKFLVGEPIVLGKNIGIYLVCQQLKPAVIAVTVKADGIVVYDGLFYIFVCSCIDLVGVGIMAHPASKFFVMPC